MGAGPKGPVRSPSPEQPPHHCLGHDLFYQDLGEHRVWVGEGSYMGIISNYIVSSSSFSRNVVGSRARVRR